MPTRGAMSFRVLLAMALAASPLEAQIISIKTVPIADGEQFSIFPSRNAGLGGVSVALDDTLLDPFRNPAAGARVRGAQMFGSPVLYSVTSNAGGGRTLPLGMLVRFSSWFAGVSLAGQQIDEVGPDGGPVAAPDVLRQQPTLRFAEESRYNGYAFAMLGRTLSAHGLSVAASARLAALNAVDGTELLYARSAHLHQEGGAFDVRVGVLKEWDGTRAIDAVLVHNRYRMTHDVTYIDWLWNPVEQRMEARGRVEHNPDRTDTWGLQVRYRGPLAATGWQIGGLLTANRMAHPKIPNYEIMSIPRDPGFSSAFNAGLGLARTVGDANVAIEAIWEPIRSFTWAEAERPTEISGGGVIPTGGRTIENDFRFSNAKLRFGVGQEFPLDESGSRMGIQLGLAMNFVHYWLAQRDRVQRTARGLEEQWLEWSPTWGMSVRFPALELRYVGRKTNGTGRPGVVQFGAFDAPEAVDGGRAVLAAPSGPLQLTEVRVTTHQIFVSFPLR